jgi:hypothetical protein
LLNLLKDKIIVFRLRTLTVFLFAILLIVALSSSKIIRKKNVQYKAEDGITITADHYFSKKNSPYILLFHQEKSSRGEYDSIAERFVKFNYNCLAVDLRSGEKYGYVENETAQAALNSGKPAELMESLKDIKASIEYIWNLSGQEVILFGSASSASLALIEGKTNEHVKAIIAFSPGEYFRPVLDMRSFLAGYPKKVFVGCTDQEFVYVQEMFSEIDGKNKIIFRPEFGHGVRGTSSLLRENPTRDEYWLSLLVYFKSLR